MTITVYQFIDDDSIKLFEKDFRNSEFHKTITDSNGDEQKLYYNVNGKLYNDKISGVISYQQPEKYFDRQGKEHTIVKSLTISYQAQNVNKHAYLFVYSGKSVSDMLVELMNKNMFKNADKPIMKCDILIAKLDTFLSDRKAKIKSCVWKELTKLQLKGSSLTGDQIGESTDYSNYETNGVKYNIKFEIDGITISLNMTTSVNISTKMTPEEQIDYIIETIIPLIQ